MEVFDELGDASRAALSRVLLAVEGVAGADIASSQELLSQAESQFARDEDRWGIAVIGFVRMEAALKRGDEDHGVQTGRSTAAAFRELDDVWGLSAVLYHLGWGLRQFGRNAEGARVLEEAIDVAGSAGLGNTVQWALADLGVAHINLGNLESAYEAFERCDQVSATVGDGAGAVLASYGRGLLDQLGGSWADASSSYARAAAGFVELGTPVAEGLALAGMARCDEVAEEEADAEARYRQVLEIGQESGEPGLVATAWEGLARVAQRRGEADQSSACLSRASALRASSHRPAAPYESLSTA